MKTSPGKVLLIGWDGADWKVIHPLMDAGKMPHLRRLVEDGVSGNLASLNPQLSPMLWTSIATGKRPFNHGILGFTEPDPERGGIRPVTNLARTTKAVWNILCQTGRRCNVIGWWPSHPAEPINGVMVSNRYHHAMAPFGQPWPLRPNTVHPPRLEENLAALRLHPQEVDVGLMLNFIPELAEIDQEKDRRVEAVAKIIADVTTIGRATAAVMHHEPWDFTAVYFDGIDHFSHGFMQYHPPRLPWIPARDFELYRNVVESAYRYHDLLLGRLLGLAGEDALVFLVSDHGFHSDHLRPRRLPREPAGPAAQHRPYGIFVARGPGIKRDESLFGASLLDVCPTILAALGLPVGADMDGKPLTNIFSEPPSLRTTPSWDYVDGPDGRHGPESSLDPADAAESLEQLIELGYIERPDADREKAAREAVRELRYNRAQAFIDAGRHAEAEAILTELIEDWPEEPRFSIRQAACMIALGKTAAARNILEDLFERQKENAVEAKKRLKEFNRRHGDTRFSDLSREDQKTLRRLRAESTENPCAVHYLLGIVSAADGDHQTALDFLKRAEETGDPGPELHVRFGKVYGELKRWKEARERFKRALAIDSEDADAHVGLARCDLAERRNRSAVERALTAVGLRFHNPEAHFVLGVGLHRIGRLHEAVRALKVAVTQNPNYVEAHRRLAYIHRRRFGDEAAAEDHIRLARESRRRLRALRYGKRGRGGIFRDPGAGARALTSDLTMPTGFGKTVSPAGDPGEDVVVVSGLPRSGTSMMMQILEAGGYPVLTDGTRAPDEDNPLGYYEYGPVTGLRTDGTWVTSARGKAVKVIAQLLRYLPAREGLRYRVIFMDRPLDAVLRSQEKMLARAGKSGRRFSERLAKTYRIQLGQVAGLLERRGIPVLVVEYDRCIADPAGVVTQVNDFLGGNGNTRKMTGAVRPALRRNQSGTPGSAGIRRNRAR